MQKINGISLIEVLIALMLFAASVLVLVQLQIHILCWSKHLLHTLEASPQSPYVSRQGSGIHASLK